MSTRAPKNLLVAPSSQKNLLDLQFWLSKVQISVPEILNQHTKSRNTFFVSLCWEVLKDPFVLCMEEGDSRRWLREAYLCIIAFANLCRHQTATQATAMPLKLFTMEGRDTFSKLQQIRKAATNLLPSVFIVFHWPDTPSPLTTIAIMMVILSTLTTARSWRVLLS